MIRAIVSLAGSMLVPVGFWIGGFDFNDRGFTALYCYIVTVFVAGMIYGFPGWED